MVGGEMVLADDLGKRIGATQALRGLSLRVGIGRICGLLGPAGAGKTTALRILGTLLEPDFGTARIDGHDVVAHPGRVRAAIGYAGQRPAVEDRLTGRENLVLFARLHHLGERRVQRRADDLLDRFGLADAADALAGTYSSGMRGRLDLAAGLITAPKVLLLDEPAAGLDRCADADVGAAIRELAAAGTTVLFATRRLAAAGELADEVTFLDDGRMLAAGTPAELRARIGARLDVTVAAETAITPAADVLSRLTGALPAMRPEKLGLSVPTGDLGLTLPVVLRELDAAGVPVADIALCEPTLDEVFRVLTEDAEGLPGTAPGEPDRDPRDTAPPARPGWPDSPPTGARFLAESELRADAFPADSVPAARPHETALDFLPSDEPAPTELIALTDQADPVDEEPRRRRGAVAELPVAARPAPGSRSERRRRTPAGEPTGTGYSAVRPDATAPGTTRRSTARHTRAEPAAEEIVYPDFDEDIPVVIGRRARREPPADPYGFPIHDTDLPPAPAWPTADPEPDPLLRPGNALSIRDFFAPAVQAGTQTLDAQPAMVSLFDPITMEKPEQPAPAPAARPPLGSRPPEVDGAASTDRNIGLPPHEHAVPGERRRTAPSPELDPRAAVTDPGRPTRQSTLPSPPRPPAEPPARQPPPLSPMTSTQPRPTPARRPSPRRRNELINYPRRDRDTTLVNIENPLPDADVLTLVNITYPKRSNDTTALAGDLGELGAPGNLGAPGDLGNTGGLDTPADLGTPGDLGEQPPPRRTRYRGQDTVRPPTHRDGFPGR